MKKSDLPFYHKIVSEKVDQATAIRIAPPPSPELEKAHLDATHQWDHGHKTSRTPAVVAVDDEFIRQHRVVRVEYELAKGVRINIVMRSPDGKFRLFTQRSGYYADCCGLSVEGDWPKRKKKGEPLPNPGTYAALAGCNHRKLLNVTPYEKKQWKLFGVTFDTGEIEGGKSWLLLELRRRGSGKTNVMFVAFFRPFGIRFDAIPDCKCCNLPDIMDVRRCRWGDARFCANSYSCLAGGGYGFFAREMQVFGV